ncbi:MAG: DUF2059 domain-containing protein [Pseudomonadota bacterium]|nr:DUF2059 domain-containing protein [Pseudomonadota bacterium]
MTNCPSTIWLAGACVAIGLLTNASAQSSAKKALVQKVLQSEQGEIEDIAHTIVERPAEQMLQQASRAIQGAPADKREAMGHAVEAEGRKYADEAYPLVREGALRIAPTTIGAVLEEKMSEDELRQLVAWLDSPVSKKFQQLSVEMRDKFVEKLLEDAQPVVDPKLQALDGRIRIILGLPRAAPTPSPATMPPARPALPPGRAASK